MSDLVFFHKQYCAAPASALSTGTREDWEKTFPVNTKATKASDTKDNFYVENQCPHSHKFTHMCSWLYVSYPSFQPIHTQTCTNFVPWHPCVLATLQMDNTNTKALTWELETSSSKWIDLITDLLLGCVLLVDLRSHLSCLGDVAAWSDPEVKGPTRKVKWWLVESALEQMHAEKGRTED